MEDDKKVLVTFQRVESAQHHPNADQLSLCRVQNYDIIMRGQPEQLVGQEGALFYSDAIIPKEWESDPSFAYLPSCSQGKRVRTIKLRGCYSEGLFLPKDLLTKLPGLTLPNDLKLGDDLTELCRVGKYLPEISPEYHAESKGRNVWTPFPPMFPRTDQPHLKRNLTLLNSGREFQATLKIDGQSATFFYDPETKTAGMCSRNCLVDPVHPCFPQFHAIDQKYAILTKLKKLGIPLAIQGEVYGPGINGNRLFRKEWNFAVFAIYMWSRVGGDSFTGKYMSVKSRESFCRDYSLPMVPIVPGPDHPTSLDAWIAFVDKLCWDPYVPGAPGLAEGVVLETTDGREPRLSAKLISRGYLSKEK